MDAPTTPDTEPGDGCGLDFERPFPIVADTQILVDELLQRSRRPHATHLGDALGNGDVRLLLPAQVVQETFRLLPERASRRGDDLDTVAQIWREEYRPHTRIVDIRTHPDSRVAAVAARDPDDEATAALATSIAPCLLLTRDDDFAAFDVSVHEWLPTVVKARQLHLLDDHVAVAVDLAAMLTRAVGGGLRIVHRSAVGKVLPLAIGAAAGWALTSRSLWRRLRAALVTAGDISMALQRLEGQARATVAFRAVSPSASPRLEDRCAKTLAARLTPLTTAELGDAIGATADERSVLTRMLTQTPAFVRVNEGWQLGTGPSPELTRRAPWRVTTRQLHRLAASGDLSIDAREPSTE